MNETDNVNENERERAHTSFLGTGWSFPPEFVQDTGEVLMTSDEEDIDASLRILFGTAVGERFFVPQYGLDMHELIYEPMSTTMKTYLEDRIKTSLLIHEPRINLISVVLDTSAENEGRINIVVEYAIRATNSRYNLVYPFYTTDSSEVRGTPP